MKQAKGQRDGVTLSNENRRRPLSSGEVEGISWRGPRTILLQKNSQGFGFTLRHFIVYPPEPSLHSLKDEENGNTSGKGCLHSCLEPMDTIFVKSVRDNGPAQMAGLCTGDRLIKVNGETILGKTYSQVIALIQNSDSVLELSIMPRDEDVLQLAYSQDAYLRGSGEAQNLPEPPTLCYSFSKPLPHSTLDNRHCRPTVSSLDNRPTAPTAPPSGQSGAKQDPVMGTHRAISALDFHFTNHNAAIASATLPPPRKSSLPASARSEALCQQALSNWYYSQAQAAEQLSPRSRRVSQDRLAGLGFALGVGPRSTELHHTESLRHHQQVAAASQDSFWQGGRNDVQEPGSRSCSKNLLAAYADYEHNYGRSVDTLKKATALVSSHSQHPQHKDSELASVPASVSPTCPVVGQQVAEPQTRRVTDEEIGYSYSPTFTSKTTHLLQQAHSIREASNNAAHLSWNPSDSEGAMSQRPHSTPVLPPAQEGGLVPLKQEVVLRQKLTAQKTPSNISRPTPVESPELGLTPSPGTPLSVPGAPTASCRTNGSLAQQAFDSLSSIPFIASMKGRRSSYLLAITTERSKSCDEGLNIFRDEGRVLSKLPKRVKSFFLDGSLDSLRAHEEARSKRHSTSELGTITVSDVRKEGWLHCKQVLSEKGKKVGGGIRPWKRVFSVLRSHSLFLYKDKREAVLHGAGATLGQDEHPPISIPGCLIDIAYSETKRKHVLRLTTQDFCEYLLQAEDREDMLSWIRAIRDNSKSDNEEIGFSRQALINKKLNDYKKHSLTGHRPDFSPKSHCKMPPFLLAKTDNSSVNRASRTDDNKTLWGINLIKKSKKSDSPKAFGVRLEDCQPALNHKFVPLIVEMCCGMVEAMGLEYTGIYRVPGNNALVSSLQEHLNKGLDINTAEERWQDLNVISSLLKAFFRKLPEPLFTDDKYTDFIEANRIEDTDDRLKTMKKLIHNLPDHYYHTLKFLVAHLKRVADYSDKNKMEPRNLALVFGPTLVRTSEDNMMDMVTHMPDRYKIVETLILHSDWFFTDGQLDNEEKAPEHQRDSQPVPNIDHLLCNIGRAGMAEDCSDSTINSLKLKLSLSPKKDLNAKEFLSKSILSAVTRKRKISPDNHLPGSSSDEDLEHEPVKSSNFSRHDKGAKDSTELEGGVPKEGQVPREGKVQRDVSSQKEVERETKVKSGEANKAQLEAPAAPRLLKQSADVRRDCRTGGAPQLRPNSFHFIQPPHMARSPLHINPSQGCPGGPAWISPSRIPIVHHTSSFCVTQPCEWAYAPVPLRFKKAHSTRTRAMSMNLDLEDRARGWRTDKVEVIRVNERGVPLGSAIATMSFEHIPPVPLVAGGTCLWPNHSSSRSLVVLRRLPKPQDQTRVWRRHTVVL